MSIKHFHVHPLIRPYTQHLTIFQNTNEIIKFLYFFFFFFFDYKDKKSCASEYINSGFGSLEVRVFFFFCFCAYSENNADAGGFIQNDVYIQLFLHPEPIDIILWYFNRYSVRLIFRLTIFRKYFNVIVVVRFTCRHHSRKLIMKVYCRDCSRVIEFYLTATTATTQPFVRYYYIKRIVKSKDNYCRAWSMGLGREKCAFLVISRKLFHLIFIFGKREFRYSAVSRARQRSQRSTSIRRFRRDSLTYIVFTFILYSVFHPFSNK